MRPAGRRRTAAPVRGDDEESVSVPQVQEDRVIRWWEVLLLLAAAATAGAGVSHARAAAPKTDS